MLQFLSHGVTERQAPSHHHRLGVFVVVVIFVALACGLIEASWLKNEIRESRAVAELERLDGIVYYVWRFDGRVQFRPNRAGKTSRFLVPGDAFVGNVLLLGCREPQLDEQLACLTSLANLRSLHVGDSDIGDTALEHVGRLSKLEGLHVWNTRITDAGVRHLESCARLKVLDLHGTGITNASIASLAKLAKLRLIYLSGTQMTPEGIELLRQRLPGATILCDDAAT